MLPIQVRPTPSSDAGVRRAAWLERDRAHGRDADREPRCAVREPATALALAADRVGHLVGHGPAAGRVCGVFDRACNLRFGSQWWTICLPGTGMGSLSLRLSARPPQRLRELFTPGERVVCDGAFLRSARLSVELRGARVWRPPAPAARGAPLARNLAAVAPRVAARRARAPNQLERADAPTSALAEACAALALPRAQALALRLVGWGEGLTPAGDDFLVGLLAGLDALAGTASRRRDFCDKLSAHIASAAEHTAAFSGCLLRLAAHGDFGERLCGLRDAVLSETCSGRVGDALDALLAIGATSGADAALGLLSGLRAWLDEPGPNTSGH